MTFIPPSLSFPPPLQSSQSQDSSERRRSSSASSTSSSYSSIHTNASSSLGGTSKSSVNKRKLLVTSNEVLEPPSLSLSSSHSASSSSTAVTSSSLQHYHHPQYHLQNNNYYNHPEFKNKPLKIRQEDFVNMHVMQKRKGSYHDNNHYNHDANDSDDESEDGYSTHHKKRHRGGGGFLKLFKKEKKSIPTTIDDCESDHGSKIADIRYAAVGSGAFIQAKDYKSSSSNRHRRKNDDDDNTEGTGDNYSHYYHHDDDMTQQQHSILPYDRLQREFQLHDDGKLPTILDVSYQSSTMNNNASMDHEGLLEGGGDDDNDHDLDNTSIDMENLFIDDNNQSDDQEEEEESESGLLFHNDKSDYDQSDVVEKDDGSQFEKQSIVGDKVFATPVYSVVTEEAYDLASRFSSCTKSNYNTKNDLSTNNRAEELDVEDSDYTAKLNSFLDKGHASYEAGQEPIGDISIPTARLSDLFGEMTLNRSNKYDLLDTPQERSVDTPQERSVDSSLRESDHHRNYEKETTKDGEGKVDSRIAALDLLQETLDQEEDESPYEMLKDCHNHPISESFIGRNDGDNNANDVDISCDEVEERQNATNSNETTIEFDSSLINLTNNGHEKSKNLVNSNETTIEFDSSVINLTNVQEKSNWFDTEDANEEPTATLNTSEPNDGVDETEEASQVTTVVDRSERKKSVKKHSPFPPAEKATKAPTDPRKANLLPTLKDESDESHQSIGYDGMKRGIVATENNEAPSVIEIDMEVTNIVQAEEKRSYNHRETQIGTTITISRPSMEKRVVDEISSLPRERKSYSNISIESGTTISTKTKDAFTQEAMANANFLFANNGHIRMSRPSLKSKVDRQRLSLMSIDEGTKAITIDPIERRQSDPLLLIENAKVELEKQKQRMSVEPTPADRKTIQVQVKREVSFGSFVPNVPKLINNFVQSSTTDTAIDASITIKPSTEKPVKDEPTPPQNDAKMTNEDDIISPVQNVKNNAVDYMSPPSPETSDHDSLEDILEGLSPSELKKRYSAITPMKSFSPFVRFKRAMRLFENDGNKTKETYPKKKASPAKNSTCLYDKVTDGKSQVVTVVAPHTFALVKEVFNQQRKDESSGFDDANSINICNSSPISSSFDEVLNRGTNIEDDKGMELDEEVEESLTGTNEFNVDSDPSRPKSSPKIGQLSIGSIVNDNSPYDETDELSITLTPTHSPAGSIPSSSVSRSDNSLSASPYSTGSEEDDIFATLIKKATECSPNVSVSSSSTSSIGESSHGNNVGSILKSAMKKKRSSECSPYDSPQNMHSVRWSLVGLSGDKRSSFMNNGYQEKGSICIYDESMDDEATPTKDQVDTSNLQDTNYTGNLEYSPMVDLSPAPPVSRSFKAVVNPREIYRKTERIENRTEDVDKDNKLSAVGHDNQYSPVVDLSPAPALPSSFRAAVNPREIYSKNKSTHTANSNSGYNESDDKENMSLVSNSIYSPTGETLCSYSPLQMSKQSNVKITAPPMVSMKKPVSPSQLDLSPKQRTPMQARKWRTLAAEAEKKKKDERKSGGKKNRKMGSGVGIVKNRTPLGKIRRN